MRVLLDTHAFLWAHSAPERLGDHLAVIQRASTDRLVSAVVAWEIAIKHRLGRLELPEPARTWVPSRMRLGAMTPLPVEHAHALGVADLPDIHGDPFDRLLVSQALALDLPVVTADPVFERYGVTVLAVG